MFCLCSHFQRNMIRWMTLFFLFQFLVVSFEMHTTIDKNIFLIVFVNYEVDLYTTISPPFSTLEVKTIDEQTVM